MSFETMHTELKNFDKEFVGLKKLNPRKKVHKRLKERVLDNAGDLYNDQYYIYKDE